MLRKLPLLLAGLTLSAFAVAPASAALVEGSAVDVTFSSGGYSMSLTRDPASPLTIGDGPEAVFNGTVNLVPTISQATFTFDFRNTPSGQSFLDVTAVFGVSSVSGQSVGANFNIDNLNFSLGRTLASTVLPEETFVFNPTDDGFFLVLTGIPVSTTPTVRTIELIPSVIPEPASLALLGGGCLAVLARRRRA